METISTLFYFILALGVLVAVHEFGHFAAAKIFGMRVDKFYIGFDFGGLKLWSFRKGETEYGIGAIPLGGYVKISGMIDESMDTEFANRKPEPWEFRAKPAWQKLIVISAGVIMNMVLAAVIFISIAFIYGEPHQPMGKDAAVYIEKGSVFEKMGLQTGDHIVAVNGKTVKYWEDVQDFELFTGDKLTYTIERNGQQQSFTAPDNMLTLINEQKSIGMRPATKPVADGIVSGSPAEKAGLQNGDLIMSIAGTDIRDWQDIPTVVSKLAGKETSITWQRAGNTMTAQITPTEQGRIGLSLTQDIGRDFKKLGFGEAFISGLSQTGKMTSMTVKSVSRIFSGKEDFKKNIGGPIAIAKMAGQNGRAGMGSFTLFVAMLSISLALMNILPIPALDGGQFVIIAIEGIIRREVSLKIKMAIQQAGFALLMIFMVFVVYNDLVNR
jgi:regulator of sigma E protease